MYQIIQILTSVHSFFEKYVRFCLYRLLQRDCDCAKLSPTIGITQFYGGAFCSTAPLRKEILFLKNRFLIKFTALLLAAALSFGTAVTAFSTADADSAAGSGSGTETTAESSEPAPAEPPTEPPTEPPAPTTAAAPEVKTEPPTTQPQQDDPPAE